MKVIKILMLSMMMFLSMNFVHAKTVDVSNLTKEQVEQLQKEVEKMEKNSGTSIAKEVRQEAEAWSDLGGKIGLAVVGAAREVGVAANEFASTDLGKIVVGIVAYKMIGQDVLSVIFGSLVLIFGIMISIWIMKNKMIGATSVEYENVPYLFGFWVKKKVVKVENNYAGELFLAGLVGIVLSAVVGLNIIF